MGALRRWDEASQQWLLVGIPGGAMPVSVGDVPPEHPEENALWIDTDEEAVPTTTQLGGLSDVDVEGVSEGDVLARGPSGWVASGAYPTLVNTDDDPGRTIYVGTVDPDGLAGVTLADGDVWIEVPEVEE